MPTKPSDPLNSAAYAFLNVITQAFTNAHLSGNADVAVQLHAALTAEGQDTMDAATVEAIHILALAIAANDPNLPRLYGPDKLLADLRDAVLANGRDSKAEEAASAIMTDVWRTILHREHGYWPLEWIARINALGIRDQSPTAQRLVAMLNKAAFAVGDCSNEQQDRDIATMQQEPCQSIVRLLWQERRGLTINQVRTRITDKDAVDRFSYLIEGELVSGIDYGGPSASYASHYALSVRGIRAAVVAGIIPPLS